jgi:hypothetical protein
MVATEDDAARFTAEGGVAPWPRPVPPADLPSEPIALAPDLEVADSFGVCSLPSDIALGLCGGRLLR